MGSVKDLDPTWPQFVAPGLWYLGIGPWIVSGRFSVADLKKKIPPQEIRDKAFVLAMTAAHYWEEAAKAGFQSTYVGMLDHNDQVVTVETLLDRGEKSNKVVMRLAATPYILSDTLTVESRAIYHRLIAAGHITTFVSDAECIFRFGFPLGSSTFKRIFIAAGMGDRYEQLATYDETVAALDEIRAIPGIMEDPKMRQVLADAKLDRIPNPGFLMDEPAISFNAKYDPAGDKDITPEEAKGFMHLDDLSFTAWRATLVRNAHHQRAFCQAAGINSIDGKVEEAARRFGDFACTVDENRLAIPYTRDDINYLIPANKEIQRAVFRALGIYAAKDAATRDHGDEWLHYINQYVTDAKIEEATRQSVWMMEQAIGTVGNRLLGRNIFEARPVEEWVEPFLPYASIEEHAVTAS